MDHLLFLSKEVPAYIAALEPDTQPLWGSMSAQHMIEHMTLAVKASFGRIPVQASAEEEKMAIRKERFFSNDAPMPKHIRVNFAPETPGPLYYNSMEEAKAKLLKDISTFFTYYEENPNARHLHPGFGLLNYEEWVQMHARHFLHHFTQFGKIM